MYFDLWSWDGTLDHIHHALYVACREQAAREASTVRYLGIEVDDALAIAEQVDV